MLFCTFYTICIIFGLHFYIIFAAKIINNMTSVVIDEFEFFRIVSWSNGIYRLESRSKNGLYFRVFSSYNLNELYNYAKSKTVS